LRVPKTLFFKHDSPFRLVLMRCRLEKLPCLEQQVFQYRSQAQGREEG
jgi:hypothetical protein